MADDNRPLKYARYAVGEIILVVIGILIALQINNWNEQRKGKENTNQLLERVQKELLYNIDRCNFVIDFYRGSDSILYKVINKKVTYDDYKNTYGLRTLVSSNESADLVSEAFNNLINNDSPLSQQQDSIVLKLKGLYGTRKKLVDEYDLKAATNLLNFMEKLKNEKEWYSQQGKIPDEQIDYWLNDPLYMNEVKHFELICLQNHASLVMDFEREAANIYEEMSDYLGLKKDTSVVKNIIDYKHYIGTYEADSLYVGRIIQENNTLKVNFTAKNDTVILESYRIYPDSKTYFSVNWFFGQLIFDEDDEVTKMVISSGEQRNKFKKID